MKTLRLIILGTGALFLTTSCQRDSLEDTIALQDDAIVTTMLTESTDASNNNNGPCNPNAYVITLESRAQVGNNWEWIWSVHNPNPGNGNNGTAQDLSHWGMQLGSCVNISSVTGAAYSGDGINWNSFTPSYQTESSQNCMTTPLIKFDFGTSGTAKSYYRLILTEEYEAGDVPAYYKSGSKIGCCTFTVTGISGCDGPVEIEIVE